MRKICQSKETVKEQQSSCISSCHLWGSDQCLIITSTLTACWDSCPISPSLPPSTSPPLPPLSSSLVDSSLSPPLTQSDLLQCNLKEWEPAAGNGEKTLRRVFFGCVCEVQFEWGWDWNNVCVCLQVSITFNVMLIQFIFNEETVSSYREAK